MAVRRRRARGPRRSLPAGTYRASFGAGEDLGAAAEIIAAEARRLAAEWSTQVPPSIRVEAAGSRKVLVTADAPPAYPNETGAMHPVFARGPRDKWTWRDKEGEPFFNKRPFLKPAAEAKAGAALRRYEQRIERLLRKAGFG